MYSAKRFMITFECGGLTVSIVLTCAALSCSESCVCVQVIKFTIIQAYSYVGGSCPTQFVIYPLHPKNLTNTILAATILRYITFKIIVFSYSGIQPQVFNKLSVQCSCIQCTECNNV